MIDKRVMDILACPACKADVRQVAEEIICAKCGRRYPVRNGIPIMMTEEALQQNKKEE